MHRALRSLVATACFAVGGTLEARTYALLTGVGNYDNPANNLYCLEADMGNMKRFVTGTLGVAETDLKILTDRQATAPAILAAFRNHLVKQAGPGDTVVFYYSGHGYHVPDHNGDEADGEDEILAPYGVTITREDSYITDDQIGALLKELRCSRAIVVLDSCHSGTGTKGLNDAITKVWKPPFDDREGQEKDAKTGSFEYRPRSRSDGFQRINAAPAATTTATRPTPVETLVLTACRAEETALGPKTGSLFTKSLTELGAANPRQPMSQFVDALVPAVTRLVAQISNGHKQVPQYEGPATATLVATAAAATATPSTPPSNPSPTPAPAPRPAPIPTVAEALAATAPTPVGEIVRHRDFAVAMQLLRAGTTENLAAGTIRLGTKVQVQVSPAQDAYVRLYHRDAFGKLTLVFPNRFQADSFVRANTYAKFPPTDGSFDFVIEEPTGLEMLKVVCSTQPFQDQVLPPEGDSPFYRLPGLKTVDLSSRGLGAYARPGATSSPTTTAASPTARVAETYVSYLVVR